MLIWINGTFGVGKTQTAHELRRKLPGSVIADPELLGFGIQRMYPPDLRDDFQETPWWEPTVAAILIDLNRKHPGDVIVPMTLHHPERHRRITDALNAAGIETRHVTLLASQATIRARLRTRMEGANTWALTQYPEADAALRGPLFSPHIATDDLALPEVVERVGSLIGRDVRYSARERLLLPLRQALVTVRHIR